jgi:membrane-associated phospholipid phosphatase
MIRPAILYWMLGAASLAAGAWLVCPAGQCFVPGLDLAGLGLAHQLRNTTLDGLMTIITSFGSIWLLLPLASFGAAWLGFRGRRRESGFLLLALLGATALAQLVKLWVARPRPDLYAISLPMPADLSFPSAHSMQVAALATALFLLLTRQRAEWHNPLTATLAMLLAALVVSVGLSRIYLQVHFPSDVLAGLLAGTFWVFGLHALMFPQSARCGQNTASGDAP